MKKNLLNLKHFLVICIFLSFINLSFTQNVFNPFKSRYQNSLLNLNNLNFYNKIEFFSSINNVNKYSGGFYMSSIKYNFNENFTSFIHLSKFFDFNSNINYYKNNFSGLTLIYKFNSKFNIGVEYGTTPDSINLFYYGKKFDNYTHFWLNKKFGDNLDIKIEYYQMKVTDY
jgi:hypothetical protein